MKEKDVLGSALSSQKHISHAYHAACEHVDDPHLLRELCSLMEEEQELRLQVYQAMHQRGWYNPKTISNQQLQQAKQQFQQMQQQIQQSWPQFSAQPHNSAWQQASMPTNPNPGWNQPAGPSY
jgi:spore coat protein F